VSILFGFAQVIPLMIISLVLAIPVGEYLALVFSGGRAPFDRFFLPIERGIFRLLMGLDRDGMDWKEYVAALLIINAFHTAISFVSNTDQQHYSGDAFSPPAHMAILTTAMFASAATGLASAFALVRGIISRDGRLGNFFSDFTRSITRVFLPVAFLVAPIFVACGIPQALGRSLAANTIAGGTQAIPLGPVASLESIKYVGTNVGGYYGANSAQPYENPSPVTNLLQNILTMLLPFSIPYAFGIMAGSRRQGVIILAAMVVIFLSGGSIMVASEASNPALPLNYPAGYVEGKEQRFTAYESAFFTAVDTFVQSGGTSSSITSMMPLGVLHAMFGMMMQCAPGGASGQGST
jgi:potassium-transporting ATPase potassium-binding subunit